MATQEQFLVGENSHIKEKGVLIFFFFWIWKYLSRATEVSLRVDRRKFAEILTGMFTSGSLSRLKTKRGEDSRKW